MSSRFVARLCVCGWILHTGCAAVMAQSPEPSPDPGATPADGEDRRPFFERMMRTVTTFGQSEEEEIRRREERRLAREAERRDQPEQAAPEGEAAPPATATPRPRPTSTPRATATPTPAPTPEPTLAPSPEPSDAPDGRVDSEADAPAADGGSPLADIPDIVEEATSAEVSGGTGGEAPEPDPEAIRARYRELREKALGRDEVIELRRAMFGARTEEEHYQAGLAFYKALFAAIRADGGDIAGYVDLMEKAARRNLDRGRERMREVLEQKQEMIREATESASPPPADGDGDAGGDG